MKRNSRSIIALAVLALGASGAAVAAEDSPLNVSVSLRAWNNKWNSWDVLPSGGGVQSGVENYTSGNEFAWIPALSLRYGNFALAGSYMTSTNYGFSGNSGTFSADRKESDVTLGYYVLPSLAINLGYKTVDQQFKPGGDFKYKGPFVGVSGAAPIGNGFSVYGNVAIGRMDADFPGFLARPTLLSNSSNTADYRLSEIGLAYSFLGVSNMVKALTITAGYRAQVLDTGLTLPQGGATATSLVSRSTRGRDNTEGFTIGISATF